MLKTIEINNLKRVISINKAVSDDIGILNLSKSGSVSHISTHGEQKIKATTIDYFVSKNNLSVGLIKMDVEGFELNALKGAVNTIKKFKPILLISIYHNQKQFFNTLGYIKSVNPHYLK